MNLPFPSANTEHPTSEKSLNGKAFQSWRWVFLAVILLAAVTIGAFYFSVVQAQETNGAITGLTLTSDTPGTLTVSWDTASPAPTDYRVDWAKSSEDYTSWTVDDGHVYPADTATTVTITGLGHDTEYKIRMRARYYKGEHKGKSWGGPWATATITVAGEPAETPTPEPEQEEESTTEAGTIDTLAATDDDTGQLVLTWGPPAAPNATPTDYHVNWAKSTEDYPADTAEAGNVHPTTTTHTLASLEYDTEYNIRVRARYTDGENADSPWTGPWTETTSQVKQPLPAAPSLIGTAATPDGHVMLSWQDPSDDPITGYQVLRGPDADSMVVIEEDTGSNSTTYTDTEPPAGQTHTYAVQARNSTGLSPQSNTVTATVPASESREEPVAAQQNSCPGNQLEPTPSDVQVDAVPIVVTSTTAEYFVLYAQHKVDTDTTMELPVLVKRGEEGTTTLSESVAALPKGQYRVEKYFVANPADVDGDCVDDITELDNLGSMNPVNPAPVLAASDGAPAIPNHEAYEEGFASSGYFTKFIISDIDKARPKLYFMNTTTHPLHDTFLERVGFKRSNVVLGHMIYSPGLVAPNGTQGVYYFWGTNARHSFVTVARVYTLVAAGMPFLNDNLALLVPNGLLHYYNANLPLFKESRMNRIFLDDLGSGPVFVGLNPGEGFGRLRQLRADERPHPRDIVVYEALPNELPPVAGIISTVPQTPLSHVNLRAVQNGIPNAYVRGFLDNDEYRSLLGTFVRFSVTESGWDVSPATAAEVAAHYAASRPTHTQTPRRDLSVRTITPLSQVEFEHWDSFGVKAANVAVLGTLGFPDGTIPDGYAIPFYFYDEFMKANNFYTEIREMMAAEEFQTDFDEQEDELKKLRKKIKKGATPQWIIDALTAMHGAYPEGQSLRYRSSTNNEDLPGFNGAGLYDSNTQHPHETVEDGIDKSLKQVYASLWNFRAFSEREFHRVDHLAAAMGVLVHPNYSDELANGVAVSFDLLSAKEGTHYVNSQLGEDLVTNPEAHSVPEEVLLHQDGSFSILATSNLVEPGLLLMSVTQMQQLRRHLGVIHTHFKGLYNPAAGKPFAMEIEFKITSENILAIKQARPWVFGGAAAVNEAPTITGDNSLSFREEATGTVASYRATDPEGGTIRWLVGGSDGNDFRISETGALTFVSPPDYESPAGVNGNEYLVTVQARDDGGKTASLDVTVTVTPVNEPPTVTGDTGPRVDENSETFSRRHNASDPEGSSTTFTWSLSGTDGGDFNISQDGELTFRNTPNYESPADSNRNNEYLLAVVATDEGRLRGSLDVTVVVNDVNEAPEIRPVSRPEFTRRENDTGTIYTFSATDPEGGTVTWHTEGPDGGDFTIDGGALKFGIPPDYENPSGSGSSGNEYQVTVHARDNQFNSAMLDSTVTVTVTDVNEGPEVSGNQSLSFDENRSTDQVLATYTGRDPENPGEPITRWSLAGTDGGDFRIEEFGALTFRSKPDYERPADSNRDNGYVFTVRASDGRYYGSFDVTVTVNDVNEPPTVTTTGSSATVLGQAENRTTRLYTYRATDPEGGTVIWSVGGTDGRFFTISDRGEFSFSETNPPDYELPGDLGRDNMYEVQVRASDGQHTSTLDVTVTVTDVNEGPEVTSGRSTFTINENEDLPNATYTAFDPEGGDVTRWSLAGTDGGDFTIDEFGALTFRSKPDYERPADSNRDNVYEVTVRPYDGRYYGSYEVTVTVNDVNEPPTVTTTGSSATVLGQRENRTTRLYTYRATDPEGGTVIWSVGGTDGRFFTISDRGEFSFSETAPRDYENPAGSGSEPNEYLVEVRASDGSNTATLNVTVTVTDVNEGPEIGRLGNAPGSVPETYDPAQVLARYTATDPEDPFVQITRWSLSGTDGGDFVMNEAGELRFRSQPDYERPADSNRDNGYVFTVRASDGRYYGSFDVTVTVNDVNEPPTVTTTGSSATVLGQAENRTTRLYTYRATDPEGGTVIWSVGGTDGRFFTISDRGEFSFSETNPPDYELPGDLGRDNMYEVQVRASDGQHTSTLDVTVTVTDVNEGPEVTSGRSTFTINENEDLPNATYTAFDPEGGDVTRWSLAGTDGGDFTIDEFGALTFRSKPDYERPADSNRDNVYEVTVRPYDGRYYGSYEVTVTVNDVNEPPTITTTSRTAFIQPENRNTALYTFSATDPERSSITWSMGGTDSGFFTIDQQGRLSFTDPPDFEARSNSNGDNVYRATVQVRDDEFKTARLDITVTVTDVNEGPEVTSGGDSFTVQENQDWAGARFFASDPEGGTVSRWSLAGRDGGDFAIDEFGALTFRSMPNYERPADSNRDNIYEVTVRPYDGRYYGSHEITVTVTPVDEVPEIRTSSRTEFTIRENSSSVLYTYRATDPEGETVRWSVEGDDGDNFAIYSGMLTFKRLPDFEIPADRDRNNDYRVTVVATDAAGNRATLEVTVAVTDQPEGPVVLGRESITAVENQDKEQVLATYTAQDVKTSVPVEPRWSLSGSDGGDFTINEDGELTFRNTPDYDRPADSNRDNEYLITIRAYDGRYYGNLNVTVTVTDQNEEAPVVTGRETITVRENTTSTLYTYRATDPDLGSAISWSVRGTDGHLFQMSERGELSFRQAPDYDIPRDSGGINEYSIEVVATDSGGLRGILAVTITVTNLNEVPTVSGPANFTIDENQVLPSSARYTATDPDTLTPATITWRVSGRDGGDFTIDRETGVLAFRITPNYERPADSNRDNVYEVTVRAYDGRNYGDFDVTVMVLAVNEGPEITGRDAFTYRENGTAALYTYRATDPEGNDFTWHLGGLDASDFRISDRGALTFALPPNFDIPTGSGTDRNQYLVTVQARDDQGNTGELSVTATVTDQNEGPTVSGRTEISVQENLDTTSILATYSAADPEGQTITRWSLSGRDGGDFRISENGELTFRNIPDYDRPADSNRDNVYLVTVRAYDGRVYGSLDVTVTVRGENEAAPVVTGRNALTVRENTTSTLSTYRASDADRNTVFTWSVQGVDGSAFMIDERGALTFSSPPNYEIPRDAGGNNVYAITIVVTDDGGSQGTLDVTVTVTEVNEGPEITGSTTYSVVEGQDLIGAFFTARDPEDPSIEVVNWRTSGTDGGDFTISQDGVLTFRNTPDYDRPADSNRDNVYLVTVQVSDGRYYGSLEATVTVTDLNEAAPTVTGRETLSIRENTANTLYTYRASDMDRGATIIWSVGGTDGDDFEISEQGALTFASPPDYERPADSDGDNVYEITIRASDGSSVGELGVTITVTAVNEGPEITGRASITVSENHEAVLASYTGRDPEDTTADITRWSVSGRDGGDFTINSDGELTFRYPPNYERPADANRDNVYEVTVRASEGRVYGNYDVRVTVEELDEAPEFRRGSRTEFSFRENGTSSLYTYRATDPEGAVVAWSVSGTDGEDFEISTGGVLEFRDPPDYDDPADDGGDNEYEVTVVATDQTGHASNLPVMVTVTDVNEGPTISGASEFTVRENHDAALGTYTARDPEIPDLEITRWSVTGRDGGDFTINEAGELTFRHPPDSERPADANRDSIYEVTVRASDGRYYGTFDVTVTVEAVDEDPEFHGNSQDSFSYQENQTSAIYTYRATDPEGEDVTWDLSGTDSSAFVISEEGELTFLNAPDYEDPVDSDDDNVYEVTVEASDENGNTAQLEVTVTVVNLTD